MLGNRIKKLRKFLNIERKELAKGIVSYSHLSKIESGNSESSEDIISAIADKLNVPRDYLLKYKEVDSILEELLNSLKESLDLLDENKIKIVYKSIKKDYPFINSIQQESYFYLLESYYFLVFKKNDYAIRAFEEELLPLINNIDIRNLSKDYEETFYYVQGSINYFKKKYQLSLTFYKKQLPLINNNLMKARINFNIALCLYRLKDLSSAIRYARESLYLHFLERNWAKIAETDNLLGVMYKDNKQFNLAKKNLYNALELTKKYNLDYLQPKILHNLGTIEELNNNFDEALKLFMESLNLKRQTNIDMFITYEHILEIYFQINSFEKFDLILSEAKKIYNNHEELFQLKIIEAKFHHKHGDLTEYEKLMKESIKYLYNNNYLTNLKEYTEEFANYYLNQKKYKDASYYFNLTIEIYKKEG